MRVERLGLGSTLRVERLSLGLMLRAERLRLGFGFQGVEYEVGGSGFRACDFGFWVLGGASHHGSRNWAGSDQAATGVPRS